MITGIEINVDDVAIYQNGDRYNLYPDESMYIRHSFPGYVAAIIEGIEYNRRFQEFLYLERLIYMCNTPCSLYSVE